MWDINEHNNSMTIFFSKSSGEIKGYATGIQDMSFYGNNAEDFSLIWDYVIMKKDSQVLNNIEKFIVNTETKELELLPEYAFNPQNYKVAKKSELINTKEGDE